MPVLLCSDQLLQSAKMLQGVAILVKYGTSFNAVEGACVLHFLSLHSFKLPTKRLSEEIII